MEPSVTDPSPGPERREPAAADRPRIVTLTASDAARVLAVDQSAFFFDPSGVELERDTAHLEWPRTFGAQRGLHGPDAPLAGLYTSYPMAVTAPGPLGTLRPVPMAALSWVSVHPDHRRSGVLRAMLTHHFSQLREAGELLGGLHAAEVAIYGRFGYAVASLEVALTLDRGTELRAPALDEAAAQVRTRFQPADSADSVRLVQDVHLRAAAETLGAVTRTEHYLATGLTDRPAWRLGREPAQVLLAYRPGAEDRPDGYAVFHRKGEWEDGRPRGLLTVEEMAAVDAPTLLALARRLVDFDLVASTRFMGRGVDDPLVWWTGSPRGTSLRVHDGLWLRLVDVGAALEARGYAGPCDVVLDVADEVCPWNSGRWRLRVDARGAATCSRTGDGAQVRLPVQALGAAYLGSRTLLAQQAAGVVTELEPGALLPVSRAMSADREPVGAIEF